jgi:hypothetical protein
MTTPLDKTLKRELQIKGQPYVLTLSPESLKLTLKGRRKGLELRWDSLVSGDTALAVALNASLGALTSGRDGADSQKPLRQSPTKPGRSAKRRA